MIKKIFLLTIIVFLSALYIQPTYADEIADLTKKLEELSKTKDSLSNQIKKIDSQISLTTLQVTQTEVSIKTLEKEIVDLSGKIEQLNVYLNQLSAAYIGQINQNYRLSKSIPSFAYLITNNFNEFLNQQKYITAIQKNSQENLLKMETSRTTYDMQKTEKAKKQDELEKLKKKLASQKISLTSQMSAKNQLLKTTQAEYEKIQSQIIALRSFANSAGGNICLSSSPGSGNDGKYFSQRDPSWCKEPIGLSTDTIGEVGCYISSLAMAYKKIGDNDITPLKYASNPNNFYINTAYMNNPVPPSGYTYKQVSYNADTIKKELSQGRYVIAQMKMSGSVSGMHFIVIIGGSDGNWKIHDPWFGHDLDFCNNLYCYKTSMIMS